MKSRVLGLITVLIAIFLLQFSFTGEADKAFHSAEDISFYKAHFSTPLDSGEYFSLPENCKGCHGFDTLGLANIDGNGMDVNLYDDWETSMMGLSGVDPLWKAKVSHEILVNPGHANELQTLCTSCHAPLGHYDALYKGQQHYLLSDLANDSLGKSGVSCHSCHGIKDSSLLGTAFTGIIPFDTNRIVYGPFPAPLTGPMQLYVGLIPAYSTHVSEGRFCSPCHTLISNTVDLNGNPTGATFVEQATYHEWVNSIFPSNDTTCQTCHMPQIEDPVQIANGYLALPARAPFNLHQFAGANSLMVNLIKNNKTSLGVNAPDANFDSTLAAINKVLKEQTLNVKTVFKGVVSDTALVDLVLENKAGHKFPSGYPARRAVVQFIVTKANGDTLFATGLFDNDFEVVGVVNPFEEHHNVINDDGQHQIYEMILGDVNGDRTTLLERSAITLKDNRLAPRGFTTQSSVYDTCKIVGAATLDADFNKLGLVEGTGKDIVHFKVALNGFQGAFDVKASVFYQSVPPFWLSDMATYSSAEIDTFLTMFSNTDKTPILIGADSLFNVSTTGLSNTIRQNIYKANPNPSQNGIVTINGNIAKIVSFQVYTTNGQLAEYKIMERNSSTLRIQLPESNGLYYIVLNLPDRKEVLKVIRL
jgi:hypothetical protein